MVCPKTNPFWFSRWTLPQAPPLKPSSVTLHPHSFLLRSINLLYLDRLVFTVCRYIAHSMLVESLFTLRNRPCILLGRVPLLFINDTLYVYRCIAHDFMPTPCLPTLAILTFLWLSQAFLSFLGLSLFFIIELTTRLFQRPSYPYVIVLWSAVSGERGKRARSSDCLTINDPFRLSFSPTALSYSYNIR